MNKNSDAFIFGGPLLAAFVVGLAFAFLLVSACVEGQSPHPKPRRDIEVQVMCSEQVKCMFYYNEASRQMSCVPYVCDGGVP